MKIPLLLEQDGWFAPTQEQILKSKEANGGRLVLETCLQRADAVNQMNRIYPLHILQREFDIYQQFVDERSSHGELDHPSEAVVSMKNTCCIVSKQWWQTNPLTGKKEWWGDLEVLSHEYNQSAAIVYGMVIDQVKFGVSSRGVGSVEKTHDKKSDVVQDDFVIIAFDIVSHPSTHNAIPHLKLPKFVTEQSLRENKHMAYERYMTNRMNMIIERSSVYKNDRKKILI